jgi:hypothetical protein
VVAVVAVTLLGTTQLVALVVAVMALVARMILFQRTVRRILVAVVVVLE